MTLISTYWKVRSFCFELTRAFLAVVKSYFTSLDGGTLVGGVIMRVSRSEVTKSSNEQNVMAGFVVRKCWNKLYLAAISPLELRGNCQTFEGFSQMIL